MLVTVGLAAGVVLGSTIPAEATAESGAGSLDYSTCGKGVFCIYNKPNGNGPAEGHPEHILAHTLPDWFGPTVHSYINKGDETACLWNRGQVVKRVRPGERADNVSIDADVMGFCS